MVDGVLVMGFMDPTAPSGPRSLPPLAVTINPRAST